MHLHGLILQTNLCGPLDRPEFPELPFDISEALQPRRSGGQRHWDTRNSLPRRVHYPDVNVNAKVLYSLSQYTSRSVGPVYP